MQYNQVYDYIANRGLMDINYIIIDGMNIRFQTKLVGCISDISPSLIKIH